MAPKPGKSSEGRAGRLLAIVVYIIIALAVPAQAQRSSTQAVTGVAVDATGAVLPNAIVVLTTPANTAVQTATTDATGTFRFDGVPPGRYDVRVTFEGFQPTTAHVTVGSRTPSPVRITLPLANVQQEITVRNQTPEVSTAATTNSDAITVDQNMLESLPVFDQDLIATLSRFLETGSPGNGGATVVVNGMEVSALRVSASAVQQIKINQDPYSAEYARPGSGRIEILTKPGAQEYHGETNVIFRDARFNARNAFSTTKPPEQRRIFEGFLGGPLGRSGKTSFMLSANDERDDNQAFIYAFGLSGLIEDTLPQTSGRALVTGSVTHQISDRNTFSIRPNYQYELDENRGAGGTTLASAATTFRH